MKPHDPARPGGLRGSCGEGSAASSLPAMAQRAGVAARRPASQSTLVAADMARWDAMAAQHRAATPAWASFPVVLTHFVIAGHSASEDARERAYDPAIHPFRKKFL